MLARALLFATFASLWALVWVTAGLPDREEVRRLARRNPGTTRLMRQREEEARRTGSRPRAAQEWVALRQVSRHLIQAVLASEDQKFFGHEGVDWEAIEQSVEKNIERRRFDRGGSTLTQQLAKNLFFGTRKTLLRKARELIVTRWLEEDLSKVRILTLYLNVIEWGDGIYGCEAASRHWFGKPAADLDEREAAGLAAMIPNPRRLNPRASPERFERARRRVLWLMARAGYLGRDVAGLGAEPPPVEVDGEDEEATPSGATPAAPLPLPESSLPPSAAPGGVEAPPAPVEPRPTPSPPVTPPPV
jgi:monofunctional biosynthetic peptidoglycan transglycosylase